MIEKINVGKKWVKSTEFLAVLAFFFAAPLFFIDLLGGRFLLTERDLGPYFVPPRFFWVESIKQGNFPLWNPYQFCGHPFFANPQHGVLYPLNGLFFLLPFDVAFNAIIILHFFLGGLFTYLFLRDLKVNPSAALISGLIFMLSGYLLSVHSLLTILLSSVWTPLIMMFFRRAIGRKGIKNEIFTAIFITLSFLSGGIEIVYGNFLVLLLMVIFSPFSHSFPLEGVIPAKAGFPKSNGFRVNHGMANFTRLMLPYTKRLGSLIVVSILFLFLSAIQLFPFVELFYHSIRGNGITYQEATVWSFAPKDVLLFFLPDAYGYFLDMKKYWVTQCWFKTLYTGGLPFILSLIFFLSPHPSLSPSGVRERVSEGTRNRKLFSILMFFSIFLSLGDYNPLYPLVFKYIPFFNGIRYPSKFLYIFILVLSVTAGLGFHRMTELSKEYEHKRYKNLFIIFSLICGLFLLFLVLGHKEVEHFLKLRGIDFPKFNHLTVNLFHAKRFIFYLALFFLLLRIGGEVKWKVWVKVLLLFFLMADLFGNVGFYGKEKTANYFQKTNIIEKISSDQEDFRIFSTGKTISLDTPVLIAGASPLDAFKEKHLPSMTQLYQLHNIWGIDVIRMRRINDLYHALTGASSISATSLIDLYGVKYVISVTPIEGDPRFELIYARIEGLQGEREDLLKGNTIKLYKHLSPFPRAWLAKDFRVFDSKRILTMMVQKDFCPDREGLLEEEPKWDHPLSSPLAKEVMEESKGLLSVSVDNVKIISENNNRLRLHVETKENSLLILSDTYYPGWKAFVDGIPQKIYQANYAFRAIPLSRGTHRVEFVYDPMSFKLGAGVSLLGILVCLVLGRVLRNKKAG